MKKILSLLTTLIVVINFAKMIIPVEAKAVSFTPTDKLYCDSAILYNTDTKSLVYEKKADMKRAPAQLVQIMTAILAIEKSDSLENVIECPANVYDEFEKYAQKYPYEEYPYNEVTTCYIEEGEQLRVDSYISAMLLGSSCEAASAIAYSIGQGSVQNFVNMMNEKAKEIGAVNTHFTNPHGLYDEDQYTTARDMLIITEYALTVPGFAELAAQSTYSTGATNMSQEGHVFENVNPMMLKESGQFYYNGTKGIKTGNSHQSGRCLVAMASRDGSNYIAVLMGGPLESDGEAEFTHIKDAINLFEWAFAYIKHQVVLPATQEIRSVKVNYAKGKDYINLKPANDVECMWPTTLDTAFINIEDIEYLYEDLNAPIKAGEKLGVLTLKYQGSEITKVDLVAYSDVELSYIKYSMTLLESYLASDSLKKAVRAATGLSIAYVVIVIYTINKRAKKRRESRVTHSEKK